jgi:tRNA (guanine-N7-)-methyltransferase
MSENVNKNNGDSAYKKRSLFGRRQGRSLRGEKLRALNEVLPQIEIADNLLSEDHTHAAPSYFEKKYSKYILEIGFGHGERLAQHSRNNPDIAFIGAEPFVNGMAAFLVDIENQTKENLRVIMSDGMRIARSIKKHTLDELYILNPDPWHKTRHHKRRIINQESLDVFAHIIKPGGKLLMTTDVPYLAEWMCTHAEKHPQFKWTAESRADWEAPPEKWIQTKYELKGAKGAKKMVYLIFERL